VAANRIAASEIERRRFLQGTLAVAGIPPLCCMTPALPPSKIAFIPGGIAVNLAEVPELRRTGAAFAIVDESRRINLILIHVERGTFIAMDRSCTHGGAQCTYNPKRRTLQCTSLNHAEYDLHGTLLHGRTHGNLRTYETVKTRAVIEIRLQPANSAADGKSASPQDYT
jgi:nitrite reductase/ring-hydroxylating ferredoxin subunit